ncbi:oxidoreductase [Streptomyces sp. L-9-10]|uniref:DsbA family protein n=1 Tax=Streptomyces sp. L-9-10 TaxID=1478131 RepID=UPI00101C67C8|nr:DsbA family protein [Streptomyces sp. L-9-10]RYJ31225.1 oxidoreductase [Streptomyces sp. L-9-10]
MTTRRRPRLYFSLRSPYSWMAVDQLEHRLPRATELIDYYPFWEPEPLLRQALHDRGAEVLYTPMSKAKHLYMLGDVKRTATRFGYPLAWPVDQLGQEWELPHLAWLAARRRGEEHVLYRALVEARWHRGERIYDEDIFIRTADAAGLDGPALRSERLLLTGPAVCRHRGQLRPAPSTAARRVSGVARATNAVSTASGYAWGFPWPASAW